MDRDARIARNIVAEATKFNGAIKKDLNELKTMLKEMLGILEKHKEDTTNPSIDQIKEDQISKHDTPVINEISIDELSHRVDVLEDERKSIDKSYHRHKVLLDARKVFNRFIPTDGLVKKASGVFIKDKVDTIYILNPSGEVTVSYVSDNKRVDITEIKTSTEHNQTLCMIVLPIYPQIFTICIGDLKYTVKRVKILPKVSTLTVSVSEINLGNLISGGAEWTSALTQIYKDLAHPTDSNDKT